MGFLLKYHADSAITHTRVAFFHFFQNAFRLAGRFEKMKKAASVCAIALSAWVKEVKPIFLMNY